MPSSATITSYYTFAANTAARASQVNANFSIYRGHIVPVDPNTATAATTNTYDLGVDDHRWRTAYVQSIDFATSTSTASLVLKGDSAATSGSFLFQIEGVTKAEIGTGGIDGQYLKAASVTTTALQPGVLPVWNAATFTANGSWTAPSNVSWVLVACWGGGGGGGSGGCDHGAGGSGSGGGGGGGSVPNYVLVPVTPGSVYSITVGAGGAGGAAVGGSGVDGNNGSTGGASSFGSLVYGLGGNPGIKGYRMTSTGGAGATNTSSRAGTWMSRGGAGGDVAVNNAVAGESTLISTGGAAGALGAGNAAGGGGGGGGYGTGGAGTTGVSGGNASTGGTGGYGAGGGGGGQGNASGAGGTGGGGIVIVFYLD